MLLRAYIGAYSIQVHGILYFSELAIMALHIPIAKLVPRPQLIRASVGSTHPRGD